MPLLYGTLFHQFAVFLQILCSAGYAWLFCYRCGWYVGELLRLKHMAQYFGTLILSGINSTSNPFNQFELLNTALSVIIFQLGPQNFSDFVIWLFVWTSLLRLFLSGSPSSPRAVPAVPGWFVAEKAAARSFATTANRPGTPTRPATRPANRGRNLCTPTATTRPATRRSKDPVSTWSLTNQYQSQTQHRVKEGLTLAMQMSARFVQADKIFSPAFPSWKYFHTSENFLSPSVSITSLLSLSKRWVKLVSRQSYQALSVPTAGGSVQRSIKHEALFISQFLHLIVSRLRCFASCQPAFETTPKHISV